MDKRAETAYEWLIEERLDDGAWPTGQIGKVFGYQAGYRKMPNSDWGCRTNTTLTLSCFEYPPTRRKSTIAKRPLDMLLARETREKQNLGLNVAKVIGYESQRGLLTYHARFDLVLILNLCWRIGVDKSDRRVRELIEWITQQKGKFGLWEYEPRPEVSRWITFDILRSLSKIDRDTEWLSNMMPLRYQSYPKKPKRF